LKLKYTYIDDQLLRENLIVVTQSNHLLIYSSHKLIWTAKLEKKIINIAVAKIKLVLTYLLCFNFNNIFKNYILNDVNYVNYVNIIFHFI